MASSKDLPPSDRPATTSAAATSTKKRSTLEKMVRRFKKLSQSSSFRSRYDIYAITVKRLIKYNRLSMINEILDHQKNFPDITNETFTAHLIYLYGKAGMFDHARQLFDEMPDLKCPRTVFTFNALLLACINARRFDEIKKLIVDLRSEMGITFDVVSYSIAINGFCKMGDLSSAEMVFDEMFADGERIWSRMVEMNVVPDVRSYNAKLHALALEKRMKEAVEDLEEAKQWYSEMRRYGCEPNRVTFQLLIPFLCEKGDVGFAVDICEEIFDKKWHARGEALQLVVNRLVMEAKIQDAEKLVQDGKKHKYELLIP
ncbi:hypothetical protein OIU78_000198 [Salix suchowensis]|nr:hypothetical protein OIU78_000198 [Salix suchowensis]